MIQINKLSKSFDNHQALYDISLHIKQGEIFGLLGPNGAGKSTTINIINSLIEADSGEIVLNGLSLKDHQNQCKMMMGVVPQEIALYEDLSALENLMFWGSLYAIPKVNLKDKANEILALVGLEDRKNEAVKNYSGGMKRRVNIASAILHQPKVLLMDEPTVGVDPQSRNRIFEIIEKLNKDGMTIIYTTHYMEEAERLCDTIAIIDEGKIAASGTINELREISEAKDKIIFELNNFDSVDLISLEASLPNLAADSSRHMITVGCKDINQEISHILGTIQKMGGKIGRIDTQKANLESIFLRLTGKQLRD